MSREHEVARLVKDIQDQLEYERIYDSKGFKSLDRLVSLAREGVPSSYVPREQVTEGWWFATNNDTGGRECVKVVGDIGAVVLVGRYTSLGVYSDFLRVPSWLVEGIGEGEKDGR